MSEAGNLSDRVNAVMKKWDLKQGQVAAQLHVDSSYVSRILSGARTNLSRNVQERLETLEKRGPIAQAMPESRKEEVSGPRGQLKRAREAAGLSQKQLAEKIDRPIGYVQALEDTQARISEEAAELICKVLPGLDVDVLLAGSETSARKSYGPVGTVGSKVEIELPDGGTARYVPLISWAQAGAMVSFDDDTYQYDGHVALDVADRKAIAIKVRGDSMTPEIKENDVVICYPSFEPRNGGVVVARLTEDRGGDVMCKVYNATHGGEHVTLTSYNPIHPPLQYEHDDFRWIYPVASVVKHYL